MTFHKQVDADHYRFGQYMTKRRWISVWHQLDEVLRFEPSRALEIGPGIGLLKHVANLYGVHIETLDLDPDLHPDHVASVTEMPFGDRSIDVVCAFQVLEHLPYEQALEAFREMARIASRAVIISLPDVAVSTWRFTVHSQRFGTYKAELRNPLRKPRAHRYDGQHYWEINKQGYALSRVIEDFSSIRPLQRRFRAPENPYHHFFVFA
jgi:predicted SAM-dependent methyltransferase